MNRPEHELLAQLRNTPPPESETKIRLIEEDDASEEAAAVYQYFRDQTGRQDVPGILKCFATNPAYAHQMVDISSTLLFSDGFLSRRQKELIATYISHLNACPYCLDSHGFFLIVHGGEAEEIVQSVATGDLTGVAVVHPYHRESLANRVMLETSSCSSDGWDGRCRNITTKRRQPLDVKFQ